jgi:hypothetical protein
MVFVRGGRASLNGVAFAIRNVSLTRYTILFVLKLANANSGVHVCDVALDAGTCVISDTHSIGGIGSGEAIYFWVDQLHTIAYLLVL